MNIQNPKNPLDNLKDVLIIIYRRKIYIIVSVIILSFVSILAIVLSKPIYKSTVVLKKEQISDKKSTDQLNKILIAQSPDEIDTEMEILKTRSVLEEVARYLKLFFIIEKILPINSSQIELNQNISAYQILLNEKRDLKKFYPQFKEIELQGWDNNLKSGYYYIKKITSSQFSLYKVETDALIQRVEGQGEVIFDSLQINFKFMWPEVLSGSKVYFRIKSITSTLKALKRKISIDKVGKTSIFKVSVKSEYPYDAQFIANSLVEKFREIRISQKQQTARYSFVFIDQQLQGISQKLSQAEMELNKFKSEQKISKIDAGTAQKIKFLSELETEKVKTDLDLVEYENKLQSMIRELKNKGYFDQTYLSPKQNYNESNSPFSALLKKLSDLELQRLELLQKRTESHPEVIAINEQIKEVKERLSNFNENTINSFQIIIESLKKKQNSLNALIRKYSKNIENLTIQETRLSELLRRKNSYEKIYTLLLDKREEMRLAELSKLQDIIVLEPAIRPADPLVNYTMLKLLLGLISGVIIGLVAIFIAEYMDDKITDISNIEVTSNYPILAVLPKYSTQLGKKIKFAKNLEERFVTLMPNELFMVESYRLLRTKIINQFEKYSRPIVFTSCEENTGKTTVVSNLAISLASTGKKVLIIDCDLKKAQIAKYFDIPDDASGLINFLTGEVIVPQLYDPFTEHPRFSEKLLIIPTGGIIDNSSELLESSRFLSLLEIVQTSFDYIFIDTPPVTKIVDTLILGKYVKDVIVLVRPNLTLKDNLEWALQDLKDANFEIQGYVVNAWEINKSSKKYRYGYGYGYGYGQQHRKGQSINAMTSDRL